MEEKIAYVSVVPCLGVLAIPAIVRYNNDGTYQINRGVYRLKKTGLKPCCLLVPAMSALLSLADSVFFLLHTFNYQLLLLFLVSLVEPVIYDSVDFLSFKSIFRYFSYTVLLTLLTLLLFFKIGVIALESVGAGYLLGRVIYFFLTKEIYSLIPVKIPTTGWTKWTYRGICLFMDKEELQRRKLERW